MGGYRELHKISKLLRAPPPGSRSGGRDGTGAPGRSRRPPGERPRLRCPRDRPRSPPPPPGRAAARSPATGRAWLLIPVKPFLRPFMCFEQKHLKGSLRPGTRPQPRRPPSVPPRRARKQKAGAASAPPGRGAGTCNKPGGG